LQRFEPSLQAFKTALLSYVWLHPALLKIHFIYKMITKLDEKYTMVNL